MQQVTGEQLYDFFQDAKITQWPERKMKYIKHDVMQLRHWFGDSVITEEEMKKIPAFGKIRQRYMIEFINVFFS